MYIIQMPFNSLTALVLDMFDHSKYMLVRYSDPNCLHELFYLCDTVTK